MVRPAGNYQLASTSATANIGIITPATLTASLTGTTTKVYDTLTTAALASGNYMLSGVLGSDVVTLNNPANGTYNTPNVGTNIPVNVTGLAISGASAGNYQLASTSATANIGIITPATLTASLTGTTTKVYDTLTTAALATGNYQLSGVLGSDVVTLNNPANGTYNTPNVGTNIPVNVTGLAISGASAGNYQLASTSATANIGTITPATLTASLTGTTTKVYDTLTTAALASGNYILSGVLGSDVVTLNNPASATYNTPNVGTNIPVNVTGLAISGASAGNYQLASTSATANIGTITPATLTASLTGTTTKVYDTLTTAALATGNYQLNGVLGSDVVTLNNPATGTYNNSNVGTAKNVAVSGLAINGAAAGNYQLAATNINGNIGIITPASLSIFNVIANNKVFDATTAATLNLSSATLSGVLTGDQVSVGTSGYIANFKSMAVANNIPVIVSKIVLNGSAAGNYSLIMPSGLTASIFHSSVINPIVPPGAVTPTLYQTPSGSVVSKANLLSLSGNIQVDVGPMGSAGHLIVSAMPFTIGVETAANNGTEGNIGTVSGGHVLSSLVSEPILNITTPPKVYALANQQRVTNLISTSTNFSNMIFLLLAASFIIFLTRRKTAKAFSFKVRTSLNTIIGFSYLLSKEKSDQMTAEEKEYLNEVLTGSRLISEELAKIENNNIAVPDRQTSFNFRTALNQINGYADLLRHRMTHMTPEQKKCLDEIHNGTNGILQLIMT